MGAGVPNISTFVNQVHTVKVFDDKEFFRDAEVARFFADVIGGTLFEEFPFGVRFRVKIIVPHILG